MKPAAAYTKDVRPTAREPRRVCDHHAMPERYWLATWMDDNGIKSEWHIEKVIKSNPLLRSIRDTAQAVPYTTKPLEAASADVPILVGGRGVDLSSDLECLDWKCKAQQVDRLFSRVWHYFDQVVVVGLEAHDLTSDVRTWSDQRLRDLEQTMRLLLYLRDLGAEDMLIFRQKPPACRQHMADHFAEAGLPESPDVTARLAVRLAREGRFRGMREHDDHVHFVLDHPTFRHSSFATVPRA